MKTGAVLSFLFLFIFSGCHYFSGEENSKIQRVSITSTAKSGDNPSNAVVDSLQLQKLFQLSEAERILGEPAHLEDNSFTIKKYQSVYSCAFIANTKDKKTGKIGAIYFMIENFNVVDSARHLYSFFKNANEHSGIETRENLGDEAYFHTDTVNFLMIIARKESKLLRLKVNKITSHTSVDEFNRIVGEIVDRM